MGFRFEDHEDQELETWLNQLRTILDDDQLLQQARLKYLTFQEIQQIHDEMRDEFY